MVLYRHHIDQIQKEFFTCSRLFTNKKVIKFLDLCYCRLGQNSIFVTVTRKSKRNWANLVWCSTDTLYTRYKRKFSSTTAHWLIKEDFGFFRFLLFALCAWVLKTSQAKSARRGPPEGWAVRKSVLARGSFWYKMCQCKSTIFNSFHKSLPQTSYPCNLRPLLREVFYKMKSVQTANVQWQMSNGKCPKGESPNGKCLLVNKKVSLGLWMMSADMSVSLMPAALVLDVWDHHHEVGIMQRNILICHLYM